MNPFNILSARLTSDTPVGGVPIGTSFARSLANFDDEDERIGERENDPSRSPPSPTGPGAGVSSSGIPVQRLVATALPAT